MSCNSGCSIDEYVELRPWIWLLKPMQVCLTRNGLGRFVISYVFSKLASHTQVSRSVCRRAWAAA